MTSKGSKRVTDYLIGLITLCFLGLLIWLYLNRKKHSAVKHVQEGSKTNSGVNTVITGITSLEVNRPGCDIDNSVSWGPRPRFWSAFVLPHISFTWNRFLKCTDTLDSTKQTTDMRDSWKFNMCESWGLSLRDMLLYKHVRYVRSRTYAVSEKGNRCDCW